MRLFLEFVPEQPAVHRQRLTYAFRLFCAIYDHEALVDPIQAHTADVWLTYRHDMARAAGRTLSLSNLYTPRSPQFPAPSPTRFQLDDEHTVLFYAPEYGTRPDWLAEIFEWVSCADEYSVTARDSVGRIPFSKSYVGRHGLNVRQPYAAVGMHMLQRALCELVPSCGQQPVCPVGLCRHFVVNTHDVDFFPLDRFSSVKRLTKNAVASLLLAKSPQLAFSQVGHALDAVITAHNALDQMPALLSGESKRSAGASFFFLTSNRHRRDANYKLEHPQIVQLVRDLVGRGMEVGVHGSYTSLDEPDQLRREFIRLRNVGFYPAGGRQHWLRFTIDRLIPALERAGAVYDASLGWSNQIGFRAGACFAFPPYDFEHERAATFVEFPLVLMDQALQERERDEESRYAAAAELLATSRRYGWGGISVLWHPTAFGGGQLSPDIGRVFWKLLDCREKWNEAWTSGAAFASTIHERYCRVGLLPPAARPRHDREFPVADCPCEARP